MKKNLLKAAEIKSSKLRPHLLCGVTSVRTGPWCRSPLPCRRTGAEGESVGRSKAAGAAGAAGQPSKEGLIPPGRDAETLCKRELHVVASQMTAVLLGPATAQEKHCKLYLEMSTLKCPDKVMDFTKEGRGM